ncbi:hypothetical protein PRIPAC_85704, partial [Pristionchus pacificus]
KMVAVNDAKIAEQQKMVEKLEKENLSLKCRWVPDATIRARFTEISKLTQSHRYSNSVQVAGMNWAFRVRTSMIGGKKYFSAYLQITSTPIPQSWSCNVFYKTRLLVRGTEGKLKKKYGKRI